MRQSQNLNHMLETWQPEINLALKKISKTFIAFYVILATLSLIILIVHNSFAYFLCGLCTSSLLNYLHMPNTSQVYYTSSDPCDYHEP